MRILAILASLIFLAAPASAGTTVVNYLFGTSDTVDTFSGPIDSCESMSVSFSAAPASVVSLYSVNDTDTTVSEFETGQYLHTFSSSETTYGPFRPRTDTLRFVVDTAATAGTATASVTCRDFNEIGGETFYGIPVGFGADTYKRDYEFERDDDLVVYDKLDRTDPTPANWETNTSAAGTSPWITVYEGAAPPVFNGFATAFPAHDEIGNTALQMTSSNADNTVVNITLRDGSFYADGSGFRDMAVEYRMGITDVDDLDVWFGVCNAGTNAILNTDGSLDSTTHAGFHWLRTDGENMPTLRTNIGEVTPLTTHTFPDWSGSAVSGAWTRLAIKLTSREDVEWYIDDVLVGQTELPTNTFQFEVRPCFGMVTNTVTTDEVQIDYVRTATTRF